MKKTSSFSHQETYTIHEVAQRSGLSISALRYYEEIGLVPDVWRDPSSGHRRYSADTLQILEYLANLRAVGMSLEEMRTYLTLRSQGDETAVEMRDLFQARAEEVGKQIAQLRIHQRYLSWKVAYWDARARGDLEEAAYIAQRVQEYCEGFKINNKGKKQMAGVITTPFGATTTAMEVIEGVDLRGKRALVTGGSSGIGVETARALAQTGAQVTLAVRNIDAGTQAAENIRQTTGNQHVRIGQLDLSDLHSVRAFVRGWEGPLDILVNNAGVMAIPKREESRQGHEMQFATNHLGHFALALGLHKALAATGHARIVSVSSVGHIDGDIDFDDIDFHTRLYDTWAAYGQSKTANILFAVEAARRWADDGIVANALNPGRIDGTNLGRYLEDVPTHPAQSGPASTGVSMKNIEQGAATSVLLAASPLVEGVSGRYFEDCNEARPLLPGIRRGVAAYAIDPENAVRLWKISQNMLNEAQ